MTQADISTGSSGRGISRVLVIRTIKRELLEKTTHHMRKTERDFNLVAMAKQGLEKVEFIEFHIFGLMAVYFLVLLL
jgi:hypothetical protein